ncbi:putative repeat protein (TIGR01451 family) [Spirosoma lacussanchae]|uniref:GDSL-type esterase/lipase family protein n=1 Tax=Spirosoma lacussanchae TaxID=1884249 RepID=UPI0011085471|nr:GDSL-type esterase/lipase family protein [Spirosoma lacussanchae]
MRLVLIALFSLLSLAGFGQTGFPTTITNSKLDIVQTNDDIEQRCLREGQIWPTAVEANNIVWTGLSSSGGQGVGNLSAPNGFSYYLKSVSISATRKTRMKSVYGYYAVGNSTVTSNAFVAGGETGTATVPVGALVRPGMPAFSFNITSVLDADPLSTVAVATQGSVALSAAKPANNTVLSNGQYSHTVTVTNTSGASLTGVTTVTDALPSGVRLVSATGTGWSFTTTSGGYTATSSTTLANNASLPAITVTVAPLVTVSISGAGNGYLIDCDTDYSAPNIMPICGTSITFGTGATSYKTMWSMQFRCWLRDVRGYRIRRINKAISGSNSSDHEALRAFDNRYDFDTKTGVFVYEQGGINDEAQSVPVATSQANLLAMIRHKQQRYPDMTMLVLAPFPVTNAGYEAGLVTRSAALSATVASVNDPKVIFISSTRTCLIPATDLTDGIHPNDSGNTKIFQAIRDEIISRNIQFSLLLIAFPMRRRRKTRDRNPAANQPKTRTRLRDRFRR